MNPLRKPIEVKEKKVPQQPKQENKKLASHFFKKKNMKSRKNTFSPETGSVTGSSTTACLRKTLPLVARNRILSNAKDFPLGTRPVRNPNLTCFDGSVDDSCKAAKQKELYSAEVKHCG